MQTYMFSHVLYSASIDVCKENMEDMSNWLSDDESVEACCSFLQLFCRLNHFQWKRWGKWGRKEDTTPWTAARDSRWVSELRVVDLGVDRKDGRVALFKVTPHLVGLLALQGALWESCRPSLSLNSPPPRRDHLSDPKRTLGMDPCVYNNCPNCKPKPLSSEHYWMLS